MHALTHEIDTLIDTNPGVPLVSDWQERTEVQFRDSGSRRTAKVALQACGQLVAMRRAKEQVEAAGKQFRSDGTSPSSQYAIHKEQARLNELQGVLGGTVYDGNGNNHFALPLADADFLIDSMNSLASLPSPEQKATLGYYAVVTGSLLEDAVLSVDQGRFRYEI
jgi:hypothetical protein